MKKTILVEKKGGERFRINAPVEKPETDAEREDLEVAEGLKKKGFKLVKEEPEAKPEAKPEATE